MGDRDEGPGQPSAEDPAVVSARLRGKRVALVVVLLVSVAFIISSAAQIVSAVFGLGGPKPLPSNAPPLSAERTCATGIRALAGALDRAEQRPPPATSAAGALETTTTSPLGLSPEWDGADAIENACARSREGLDAWAALRRMRVAAEQSGRLTPDDLSSVRRDVMAHLPAELR